MATIHPFKAWHPKATAVQNISCPPYDVISTEEARELADGKPYSFLNVIRPEINLPNLEDAYDDRVYREGRKQIRRFMKEGLLQQDDEEAVYIYRLIMGQRSQMGIFTCVSVQDYDDEVILKHELTRPTKEDDRTRHIKTQEAHAEPVMMTFKDTQGVGKEAAHIANMNDPLFDFTSDDGVRHTVWRTTENELFTEAFDHIDHLYIADGHHRCKSASRVAAELREERGPAPEGTTPEYEYFPAVLFPMNQMHIMSYNRIIKQVPGHFWKNLTTNFEVQEDVDPEPSQKGKLTLYYQGTWYGLTLPDPEDDANAAEKLDVSLLQQHILEPMLDITDQRTDENVDFVGGIRGSDHLEELVDEGHAQLAIGLYPTSIEELVEVSDEGLLMPPKSTWFEPKLRSGILVHTF
ncbi:MAG: DUF1015 domain-containing protein [Bacteroidota bacterium]